ncbi:hypothetical protein PTKIN_Ptkin09bG0011100 [Pterospermum kingtungense]
MAFLAMPRLSFLLSGVVGGLLGIHHTDSLPGRTFDKLGGLILKRHQLLKNKQYVEYMRTFDLTPEKLKEFEAYVYENVPAANDVKDVKNT